MNPLFEHLLCRGDHRTARPVMPSFPLKQLSVVGGILFTHHFGASVIFPFLPFLTHDFFPYLKSNQIGYYAGFLASAYFTGSFFGSFMWGRLSDFLGRRPILLCGIVGSMLSSMLFGFSMSFGWAVAARLLWGFLDGNLGVSKTYLFEATDVVYHPFTFSLVGASSGLGRLVGPIAGGFLSCPAVRIPGFDVFFFRKFPYLLPCLVAVCLAIINLLASCFFLRETQLDQVPTSTDTSENQSLLESDEDSGIDAQNGEEEDLESEHWDDTISRQGPAEDQSSLWCCRPCCKKICRPQTRQGSNKSVPIRKLLRDRRILLSCVLYGLLGFSAILTNELLPLLLVSSHKHGGYNFDTSEISLVLTGSSIFQILSQIVVFPNLARKYSYKTLFRAAIFMFMIGTVCTPFMNQMTGPIPERDGEIIIENATEILPHYSATPSNVPSSQQPGPSVLRYSARETAFNTIKSNNDSNIGKCRLDDKGGKTHVAISDVPIKVWAVVVFTTAFGIVGRVSSFTAIMVMVGNSAMPYFRGTVNGISQSFVALARLLGPIVGGNLFAWTTENVLIDVIILCLTLLLPDSINKPRVEDIREDEDENLTDDESVLYSSDENEQSCSSRRTAVIA
ncbi:probable peptide/nitrate transporter At3g43790 isoform X2 [Branchiostoma floridae]|uniref:Probable peptide/nitrate transporter At3g43790 isoform X2 n=1 Tax=Branchiostoma floridae TaxID=7739 RepID=A0A9J7MQ80_BRAFL|nr:probable peptide/nitrate transporter At3g43790 isoform X2 [Branchiostoma floridae]